MSSIFTEYVFVQLMRKPRLPPWSLIGWDIFLLLCHGKAKEKHRGVFEIQKSGDKTTWQEAISQCSLQNWWFLDDQKTKMATLASDWWSIFLCNCQTEFNWKKHPQSLWSLYFSGWSLSACFIPERGTHGSIMALGPLFFCSWSLSAWIPIHFQHGFQFKSQVFGGTIVTLFGLLLSKPKEITTFIPYFIIQCKLLYSIAKSQDFFSEKYVSSRYRIFRRVCGFCTRSPPMYHLPLVGDKISKLL